MEHHLIERYFHRAPCRDAAVGIGDDAAVLNVPPEMQLVASTDTLNAGIHFPEDTLPADIGYKALAVNLSDLAAMGAEPRWFTLSLSLPEADTGWLEDFSRGLFGFADECKIAAVGGDLCQGPLSITIQVHGLIPTGTAITRAGARCGDSVWVSGTLGDAGLALRQWHSQEKCEKHWEDVRARLLRPMPRIKLGLALRGLARAMIDLSDGLASDLKHILRQSDPNGRLGAEIRMADLPLSPALRSLPEEQAWDLALCAGDDYELCFCASAAQTATLEKLQTDCPIQCIGRIVDDETIRWVKSDGSLYCAAKQSGYQHFATT
ncbi:MAG: thiamine-phosphate kinase [Candidatus Eutrophobiaceae bacterium]